MRTSRSQRQCLPLRGQSPFPVWMAVESDRRTFLNDERKPRCQGEKPCLLDSSKDSGTRSSVGPPRGRRVRGGCHCPINLLPWKTAPSPSESTLTTCSPCLPFFLPSSRTATAAHSGVSAVAKWAQSAKILSGKVATGIFNLASLIPS